MADGGPINGRDPAALLLIEVNDTLCAELIGPVLVICIIHVKGQQQSLL
jgi:hypothetical protein